ncbi:MAG: dUTP diphosphatase [Candidatus Asgardarchaeia archaeon]
MEEKIKELEKRISEIEKEISINRIVKVKKLHPNAIVPKYHTKGAVAFDMYPLLQKDQVFRVPPHSQKIIPTGIAFSIPDGFELRISPRSGQSAKEQISIRNSPGILDSDYRGELMVIFVNNKETVHIVTPDQRICQVKLSKAYRSIFQIVEELDETDRGEGRFGSTGN